MKRGRIRSTGHHRYPGAAASIDDGLQRDSLRDHGGRERHVGPLQVGVFQRAHVHVHEAKVEARRKHRGDRDQPKRRMNGPEPGHVQGEVSPPEGRGLFGIDEKSIRHGDVLPRTSSHAPVRTLRGAAGTFAGHPVRAAGRRLGPGADGEAVNPRPRLRRGPPARC